jgi:signal transduction histidine kinase
MSAQKSVQDQLITPDIAATQEMPMGNYYVPQNRFDDIDEAITRLAQNLSQHHLTLSQLSAVDSPSLLNDILESISQDFQALIPYARIGFSFIENNGTTVVAYWDKSHQRKRYLKRGFFSPLEGSSLKPILDNRQPRIIHDLLEYLKQKPNSRSTQLLLKEGFRSSLSCPLIANGIPLGFVFFSSVEPNTYTHFHIDMFSQVATQLSVVIDKARVITHLAKQKTVLEQQNAELLLLNQRKNMLLGIAAHDLRSPLSNVQVAAHMLADVDLQLSGDEQRIILNELVQQSNYMMDLLNDLLDVSHIESGKFSVNPQRVEITPFLESVCQRYEQISQSKDIHLNLKRLSKRGAAVSADPLRLQQVFDNLISNAVKFSPPGSQIHVRALHKAEHWRFEVQDEGPGISEIDQKRLFQDFARLNILPINGERSTGLGLAIARRVIEAHQGHIGVDSRLGHGATFWFTLPV